MAAWEFFGQLYEIGKKIVAKLPSNYGQSGGIRVKRLMSEMQIVAKLKSEFRSKNIARKWSQR